MDKAPTKADGLRKMREDNWQEEQNRQAAERKATGAARPKPAAIARSAGNVPAKRQAKKTKPLAKR